MKIKTRFARKIPGLSGIHQKSRGRQAGGLDTPPRAMLPCPFRACGGALLVLSASALAVTAEKVPTLDDFLSFPARKGLVSCEESGLAAVAWVETRSGLANVYAANNASEWTPTKVTGFSTDDGTDLNPPIFVPGSRCSEVLVEAGPTAGANPNHAASIPATLAYLASWQQLDGTAAPNVIEVGPAPVLALVPGTRAYLFSRDEGPLDARGVRAGRLESASLWMQQLPASRTSATPHVSRAPPQAEKWLGVKQGTITCAVPGGADGAVVFCNDRGTHGLLGLYSPSASRVRWVSPSVDFDTQPAWGPGGKALAWVRARGPKDEYERGLGGHRGPSFEIWVDSDVSSKADRLKSVLRTGTARAVFRDTAYGLADAGSGYGVRPGVAWAGDKTLIIGSEAHPGAAADGWYKPVAVDLEMEMAPEAQNALPTPRELLPANEQCEVKSWGVSGAASDGEAYVYMVHNCGDAGLDTRGISRVPASASHALASEVDSIVATDTARIAGMSSAGRGFALADNSLFYLVTTVDTPAVVAMLPLADGAKGMTVTPTDPLPRSVIPTNITISPKDGAFAVSAQVFAPAAGDASGAGIIFTHGGSQRQMFNSFHFSPCYGALYALNQYMSSVLGHTVVSVNYRSGVGRGFKFRVCDGCMWLGGAEYQDVAAGARALAGMPNVNGSRVGVYGLSYGGLNALQALTRDPDLFAAGVANAPVYNWVSQARYDGSTFGDIQPALSAGFHALATGPLADQAGDAWLNHAQNTQALARRSSPAAFVGNLSSPLLLIQGDADDEVAFSETISVVRDARRGKSDGLVQALVFPDETHGLARYESQLAAAQATADFLSDNL